MSVIGIAGSCALLVTGFGLQDSVLGMYDKQFEELWHFDMTCYLAKDQNPSENRALEKSLLTSPHITGVLFSYEQGIEITNPRTGKVYASYLSGARDRDALSEMITLRSNGKALELTDDGAIVTQKIADELDLTPGDTLAFTLDSKEYRVRVSGVCENYILHYVYLSDAYYQQVFGEPMPYDQFKLRLDDPGREDAIAKSLLSSERVAMIVDISKFMDMLQDMVTTINSVVMVLIASSAVLLFVVMFNLTNINIAERERELATLKLLGFYDRETYQYVYRENRLLTVIGTALGLALGVWMHYLVMHSIEVGNAMFVKTDVSRTEDVKAMVDRTVATFGRLDFAFNNAGIFLGLTPLPEYTEEMWERNIGVNLKGVWLCMKYEIPRMLENGGGAIVNTSSIAGLVAFPGHYGYVASKSGVNGITKGAALEFAASNVRVNAVCPGVIDTPMAKDLLLDAYKALHPLGRFGTPKDIASTAVWLCSDDASFITGQILAVDGGYTIP